MFTFILIILGLIAIVIIIIAVINSSKGGSQNKRISEPLLESPNNSPNQINADTDSFQANKNEAEYHSKEKKSISIDSITDKLHKLSELQKKGLISREELDKAKAKLLSDHT